LLVVFVLRAEIDAAGLDMPARRWLSSARPTTALMRFVLSRIAAFASTFWTNDTGGDRGNIGRGAIRRVR
jgi:hypothetical protein